MKRTGMRILAVIGVLSVFVWIGAILIGPSVVPPGQLEDTAFPEAAEPICAEAKARADELPTARDAGTPTERAETIRASADIYSQMTGSLSDEVPETDDARFIGEWIDDWNVHIADRLDYADRLDDKGPAEVFLESTKVERQVSRSVNRYAEINRMPSCEIPGDL